jgi:LuxR family maltose regulon positive regulatory protein
LTDAAAAGRVRAQIEALLLAALAQQAAGQQPAAVAALAQAVQLAEPAGFIRLFVEEAAALSPLLPLVRSAAPAFVDDLLARFGDLPPVLSTAAAPHAASSPQALAPQPGGLVEPLSERELEILRLVADGQSNQAIADRLVITVGTAKWHISNIYGKLGVRSRTQALARTRELGLLTSAP